MNNQSIPHADVCEKASVGPTAPIAPIPRDGARAGSAKPFVLHPCPPHYKLTKAPRRQRPFYRLLLLANSGAGPMMVSVSEARTIYRRMFGRDRDEPHVWRAFAGNKILIRKDWP